jgi:hypothetical protein
LKSKEKTTLKVLANELAAVRIAMIKSERRSFMDIRRCPFRTRDSIYPLLGLAFGGNKTLHSRATVDKFVFKMTQISTIR